jgi:hypothetical protein
MSNRINQITTFTSVDHVQPKVKHAINRYDQIIISMPPVVIEESKKEK